MSNSIDDLTTAFHLLRRDQEAAALRNGKGAKTGLVKEKSLKDWFEEDQAILSGQSPAAASQAVAPKAPPAEDLRIKLSDLVSRLKDLQQQPAAATSSSQQTTSIQYTSVQTEISLEFKSATPVQGLVRRDKNLAETDRYTFEFIDASTFKITDKWSNKSTTIWGDPHVDVSDVEGNRAGDFGDLKSSDTYTTMELQDGTRVTFTAPDNGAIQAVDITKGSQHLHGVGAGSQQWSDDNGLFSTPVDSGNLGASSQPPLGDVVRAGGDGNDWFDTSGRLVWGKTTSPAVTARPAYMLQLSVQQTITQVSFQQTIDRQF
jgi:hypothetical protein